MKVLDFFSISAQKRCCTITGAKAIGTAWTIAPSEEEESIWGGKTLTKGNCTLFNKLTIVKLSMTMRVCFHVICSVRIILRKSSLLGATEQTVLHTMNCIIVGGHIQHQRFLSKII